MNPLHLQVRFIPFSKEALHKEICKASFALEGTVPPIQARYLGSYLAHEEADAKTIVVEYPYVDRHYLEEYTNYYATTLRPPPTKATRLHFFKRVISNRQFTYLLRKAASGKFKDVSQELSESYLGFSVIRPLPDAPIGRTVLATFRKNTNRFYTLPPHPYRVHLCGLKLTVCGVPFQQQEQAVGACATTAVWSALAQVMRHDGGRAPTPFAVTEAATRNLVSDRVFPATSGLKDEQILEAMRQFGYSPLFFVNNDQAGLFTLAVKCYLRSRIPVILKVHTPGDSDAHAITVVGFREDNGTEIPAIEYKKEGWDLLKLRSKGLTRIYAHDDRLGPYARAEWIDKGDGKLVKFKYLPEDAGYEAFETEADVLVAMVPLYPKIRLSAHDLVGFASELLPLFKYLVGPANHYNLLIDLRFALAGECLELLYNSEIPSARFATFARQAVLSRYVGLITFSVGESLFAYVICDSTDMRRELPAAAPLLAIIPRYEEYIDVLKENYGQIALIL